MPRCAVSIASATPKPMLPQVAPVGERRVPVDRRAESHGSTLAQRIGHDVRGGVARRGSSAAALRWRGDERRAAAQRVRSARVSVGVRQHECVCMAALSASSARHVEPAPLGPALQAELGELHALRAFEQVPAERAALDDVPQEQLPLHLERVVVHAIVRHLLPVSKKSIVCGCPDSTPACGVAARGCDPAIGAVRRPRSPACRRPGTSARSSRRTRVHHELLNCAMTPSAELERRVRGVVGGRRRTACRARPSAPGCASRRGSITRLHLAEQVVEHVAPVAQHVDDDAAAVLLAVVPRRPLRVLPVAFEHPVAELAAHAKDAPEEAGCRSACLSFSRPGSQSLSCTTPCLHAGALCARDTRSSASSTVVRDRLLAVDVLAGGDRLADQRRAQAASSAASK